MLIFATSLFKNEIDHTSIFFTKANDYKNEHIWFNNLKNTLWIKILSMNIKQNIEGCEGDAILRGVVYLDEAGPMLRL